MPRFLLGSPSAEVVAAPGLRVFSNQQPFVSGDGESAPVTLGLGDVWYVSVEDAALTSEDPDQGIRATLNAYIPPSGAGQTVSGISDKIRQFTHYGTIIDRLRSSALSSAAQAASVGGGPRTTHTPAQASPGPVGPGGPSRSPRPSSDGPTGPSGSKSNGPATGPSGPTRPSAPGATGPTRTGATRGPSGDGPGGPGNPTPRSSGLTGPSGPSGPTGPSGPRGPQGPNR